VIRQREQCGDHDADDEREREREAEHACGWVGVVWHRATLHEMRPFGEGGASEKCSVFRLCCIGLSTEN
jgi:hypothetical protein